VSTKPFRCLALIAAILAIPTTPCRAERPPQAEAPHPVPRQMSPAPLTGACYLTFGERLECTADSTESECHQRCDDLLCDDYTWIDRLPCWNWGYGG
jgi:hypothetical protein